jgi:hypothetical protein
MTASRVFLNILCQQQDSNPRPWDDESECSTTVVPGHNPPTPIDKHSSQVKSCLAYDCVYLYYNDENRIDIRKKFCEPLAIGIWMGEP